MRAVYTGHETLTFMDYLDLDSGRTLTAVPGGTYDVSPSGGRLVPALPPGFVPARAGKPAGAGPAAEDKIKPARAAGEDPAPEVSE